MQTLFTRTRIDVAIFRPPGFRSVTAWRLGEWAAYRHESGVWRLVILPLGLTLPPEWSAFTSVRQACQAMAEIVRLRNSWSVIRQADLTLALRDQLKEICARHGAVHAGHSSLTARADEARVGMQRVRRLNGYLAPAA